jgi:putative membrane protein
MTLATAYTIVLLLHISADIVFVAGLLAAALLAMGLSFQRAEDLARDRQLIARVRRWNLLVTTPALGWVWMFGLWLAWRAGWFAFGWLHAKLALVIALSALHGILGGVLRRAAARPARVPSAASRAAAPLAVVAIALIVWLALFKPA